MAYRNKTYIIFDADNDMWAYAFMKGWNAKDHMDFDFHNAHDIRPLTDRATEETIRQRLRERLLNTKQAIVLVGESTKNLYRFVRWEIETCLKLNIPIIAVNLNGQRSIDRQLCPPILADVFAVHVSFNMAIIKHALDHFPEEYEKPPLGAGGPRHYSGDVYKHLGL